jgi:hypothetical protein
MVRELRSFVWCARLATAVVFAIAGAAALVFAAWISPLVPEPTTSAPLQPPARSPAAMSADATVH